jgi:hypothetical protein
MTSETGEKLFIVSVTAIFIIGQSLWLLFQFKREEKFRGKFQLKPKQNIGLLQQSKAVFISIFEISVGFFGLLYALLPLVLGVAIIVGIPVLGLFVIIKIIKWVWYF